jgi:DNA processing protein
MAAVVGSRHHTPYGEQVTRKLVSEMAFGGLVIVSGLAYGIDTLAHTAAIEAGGTTVAVLGNAIDEVYPRGNQRLAERILEGGGALISEYPPGAQTQSYFFPERNRIIAGLCIGVLVTEAGEKSGALITANLAADSGREVMAVPGNINSELSIGPNRLIRTGAAAITDAGEVFHALGLEKPHQLPRTEVQPASANEAVILGLMETGVTDSQELIERSRLNAATFAQVISLMEITGKVRNLGAGTWIKAT